MCLLKASLALHTVPVLKPTWRKKRKKTAGVCGESGGWKDRNALLHCMRTTCNLVTSDKHATPGHFPVLYTCVCISPDIDFHEVFQWSPTVSYWNTVAQAQADGGRVNYCEIVKFFGYTKYYSVTVTLGLLSFDTVIHNYRKSFLCVWSKRSNDMVKLLRCVCSSAFLWVLLCFIYILYCSFFFLLLYCLSVCLYIFCLCLRAICLI